MKKLILSVFSLLVLTVAVAKADMGDYGVVGGGWNVDVTTGSSLAIGAGSRTKLRAIFLSTDTTNAAPLANFLVVLSTPPSIAFNGSGGGPTGGTLFMSTAQIV